MRSTGEVMGIDYDFASSYAKAQIAAGQKLPTGGARPNDGVCGGRRGGWSLFPSLSPKPTNRALQ
jgi:hypothetical protein